MDGKGGYFRKKRIGFAMVSNDIIRDENISLKAKGLYALIQSYITLEDFTLYKSFLMKRCKEGEKSFESTWKELKDTGHLVQYKLQDDKGKYFYEYDLLDSLPSKHPDPQNRGCGCNPDPRKGGGGLRRRG